MARVNFLVWLCSLSWGFGVSQQQCIPFTVFSADAIVQFGDHVQLNCSYQDATGGGTGGVSWTKDPSLSIGSDPAPCHCTTTYPSGDNTASTLTINVTDGSDLGSYTCSALIGFGTPCTRSVQVIHAVPPVLTAVGSSSQTANQGSTVTFSVTLTNPGLPLANVVWTKDGVTLYNTSNMAVTSTTLQLSNIQPGDRGQYVVTATNKAGSSAVTFSLFEQFNPQVNMSVTMPGSQPILTCEAYGYPMLTDLMITGSTTSTSHISTPDNYTSLGSVSIVLTTPGCANYMCKATNSYSTTSVSTTICTGLSTVTMVTASPIATSPDVIGVTWSRTPYATGYLVYANYGVGGAFIVNVTKGTSVSVGVTCGGLYTLQVQAYNSSSFSSLSPAVEARAYCSSDPVIKSVTVDNSIIRVTFANVVPGNVRLTAFQDNGSGHSWNVTVGVSGEACLSGLKDEEGVEYSLCAYFAQGSQYCYPEKVTVGKGNPVQQCSMIFEFSSSISGSALSSQPSPLVIGIIIVGVFGAMATVFCLVGFFLACKKGKSATYDTSSSSVCSPTKHSPTPPEGSSSPDYYSCIDTTRPREMTMMSGNSRPAPGPAQGESQAYNKTFDRSLSGSYLKDQGTLSGSYLKDQGTCATMV